MPIDETLPQVIHHLKNPGALVLIAAPGAGKTTRVPPAVLDSGLAELEAKRKPGQIVVLQPRRVAARAAASFISSERGKQLGNETGYLVRHERCLSADTRILVCTEGVFLRKLQDDPLLDDTAVVIFDEFHERRLESDLALALVRQVRKELRPDLKLLVMSATLDAKPVSRYLDNCPIIESPGRNYPVGIEYLPFAAGKESLEEGMCRGIKQALSRSSGHILAFLPGLQEIRRTNEVLDRSLSEDVSTMQLYGDLPLAEQARVLNESGKRKVVLSTNVAETSITIDGVTAVVDSGLARVNRLDTQLGLNRLELGRISQASATQRAGRAGRTTSGICLRLWSEREQQMLHEFELPEIARVDLSECVLQLHLWGEKDLRSFPWFETPPAQSLTLALELLEKLDALKNGMLTDLGKRMGRLPLQPRLSRLIIAAETLGEAESGAVCAALLSERDPFRRKENKFEAKHKSESDLLDKLWAIKLFQKNGLRDSIAGELITGAAKQILRNSQQLLRLLENEKTEELKISELDSTKEKESKAASSDEALQRAILSAFPDRVCRRREPKGRRALMVGGRGVRLLDESAVADPELFVAVELIESGQSEALVRQASGIEDSWLPPSHLSTDTEFVFDTVQEKIMAMKRTRFCDLVIDEMPIGIPPEIDTGEILASAIRKSYNINELVDDESKQYLARIVCLNEKIPELGLPEFGPNIWEEILHNWCFNCTSIAELKSRPALSAIQNELTPQQIAAIEIEAPERILVPSGNRIKLRYELGKDPVLAVRIQELFGMAESPKIARGRQAVLLHLLAPNYRVQQITSDLAGFWKNTYADVKKDLKARYPKHSWPDNPLLAEAERSPKRKPAR